MEREYTEGDLPEDAKKMMREICSGRGCGDCPLNAQCPHHFTVSLIKNAYNDLFHIVMIKSVTEQEIMEMFTE